MLARLADFLDGPVVTHCAAPSRQPVIEIEFADARLRARPGAPEVLVLTTFDDDHEIVRAVEAGEVS